MSADRSPTVGPLSQFTVLELQMLTMGLWWLIEKELVNPDVFPEWRESAHAVRTVLRAYIEEHS
jgi:hypothetical protein